MTSTSDILGHPEMLPCVYKKLYHYEPCRNCDGKQTHLEEGKLVYTCINYKASINGNSHQTEFSLVDELGKDVHPYKIQSPTRLGMVKTDDTNSQQTGERDKNKSPVLLPSRAELGSSADTYIPMIIRNNELIIRKHSKLLDLIRRATDGGAI